MTKKQMDFLGIEKSEYGGYVVYDSRMSVRPIFSTKDLEECLEFIKTSITFDDNNNPEQRMLFE